MSSIGYTVGMATETRDDWLAATDEQLLTGCDVHIYKASGPGGQHRNKVSSAVRLRHHATGISAVANDSRSQHSNRRLAIARMRMNLALQLREPALPDVDALPPVVAECIFTPKKATSSAGRALQVGRKDPRFWPVTAYLLDWLDAAEGRLGDLARTLDISTGNLTRICKADRHFLAAVQTLRRNHGLGAIS